MDRKTFLKQLLAGGVALGAGISKTSLFTQARAVSFPIPEVRDHVRHGLLSPEGKANFWPGPKWLSQVQRDRFYANGFAASKDDLHFATITVAGKKIALSVQGDQLVCQTEAGSRTFHLVNDQAVRCLWEEPIRIHVARIERGFSLPAGSLGRQVVTLPLQGTHTFNGKQSHMNEAHYFKQAEQLEINGERGALVLFASRT